MKTQKSIIAALNKTEEIVIIVMFALMVIVIFAQVIMRYVFNDSLYWSEELGKFLFVWISWLGISLGEREGEHIKITMLTGRFAFKKAHIFNILSSMIVFIICIITFYASCSLVLSQWTTHYAGIHISISFGYLAVATGTGLMMIRTVAAIIKSYKAFKAGPPQDMPQDQNLAEDPSLDGGEVQ